MVAVYSLQQSKFIVCSLQSMVMIYKLQSLQLILNRSSTVYSPWSGSRFYSLQTIVQTKAQLYTTDYDRLQTADCRLNAMFYRLQTIDHRLQTAAYRLQSLEYEHTVPTIAYRLQTIDCRLQSIDYRLQTRPCTIIQTAD